MPISVMENVISNSERRAIVTGEPEVVPRISDVYAAQPAITGKIELEYEGELVGGHAIARELIRRAADATFQERAGGANLVDLVRRVGLAKRGDAPMTVAACELVLEALVARKRISRSDGGIYGRAEPEKRRRRPNEDLFGGGLSA